MADFKGLRAKKLRVGPRWIVRRYRKYLKEMHPVAGAVWRGSNGWRSKFYRRNKLSLRKRTNAKKYGVADAIPKLQSFVAGIMKRCKDTYRNDKGWDKFYGQYPRELRSSLDQVCSSLPLASE